MMKQLSCFLTHLFHQDAFGGRGNCRYNECANCLNSQDCGFNEVKKGDEKNK